ncbi:MAG: hypothetical protein HDT42_02745 [Ruminococcaceae bacterium]|nr:hypothetical protein [Oscillospiraceae bacterium]
MEENINNFNEKGFEKFLDEYHIREYFDNSDLEFETLQQIRQDYQLNIDAVEKCCELLESCVRKDFSLKSISYHSLRCRPKDSEHLIEKIIRKRGKEQSAKYKNINVNNYKEIVRDLIGLRILVIKKEDWESIHNEILHIFSDDKNSDCYIAEKPVAYIRYGDRNIFEDKIKKEYSNKGYRSQHYIVRFNGFYCEIQVRTLAEEVFGEFDHKVKYPYRNDNNFLLRYTNMLSKLTDMIDEMMSTCFQLNEPGWKMNAEFFEEDCYDDWSQTSQSVIPNVSLEGVELSDFVAESPINIQQYAIDKLLRKENGKNGKSNSNQ